MSEILKAWGNNFKIILTSKTVMVAVLTAIIAPLAVWAQAKFGVDGLAMEQYLVLGALKLIQQAAADWAKSSLPESMVAAKTSTASAALVSRKK